MSRTEFSLRTKKAAWERAGGMCECGCDRPFTDHPKERPHYDHDLPDYLGGDTSLGNCVVMRVDCHNAKTVKHDIPKIVKARRGEKKRRNLDKPKTGFNSNFRRKLDGTVVPKEQ